MIDIFTDGSYDDRTKSGGWCFVVVDNNIEIKSGPTINKANSTDNELLAILNGIKYINRIYSNEKIKIHTDCYVFTGYIKNGINNKFKGKKEGILECIDIEISNSNNKFEADYICKGNKHKISYHTLAHKNAKLQMKTMRKRIDEYYD